MLKQITFLVIMYALGFTKPEETSSTVNAFQQEHARNVAITTHSRKSISL